MTTPLDKTEVVQRPIDRSDVDRSIADFFSARNTGGWPIPLSEGVASVRRWHPGLQMTDIELRSRVAKYAIGRGLNVYFDGPGRSSRLV